MHGSPDKIQPYAWTGVFGYEGTGPTDHGVHLSSYYPQGAALVGNIDEPLELNDQGAGLLLVSLLMLGVFMFVAFRPTTATQFDSACSCRAFCCWSSVVFSTPLWPCSIRFNTLRSHRGRGTHRHAATATLGCFSGRCARANACRPTRARRWVCWKGNVSASNLTSTKPFHSRMVDGNSWFLNWIRCVWTRPSSAKWLKVRPTPRRKECSRQTVRFILLASRALLLDLMMLEAMLVVDDVPSSSVFHIDTEMVAAPANGSLSAPAWATRPSTVDAND